MELQGESPGVGLGRAKGAAPISTTPDKTNRVNMCCMMCASGTYVSCCVFERNVVRVRLLMLEHERRVLPVFFVTKAAGINKDSRIAVALQHAEKGATIRMTPEGTFGRAEWRDAWFNHFKPLLLAHRAKYDASHEQTLIITTDGFDAHAYCLDVLGDMKENNIVLYAFPSHTTRSG
jgi:hypothetical protein